MIHLREANCSTSRASFPTTEIWEMGLTGALFGCAWGFGIQMYSNALRKLPLGRGKLTVWFLISGITPCPYCPQHSAHFLDLIIVAPYVHVAFASVGSYAGYMWNTWEENLLKVWSCLRNNKQSKCSRFVDWFLTLSFTFHRMWTSREPTATWSHSTGWAGTFLAQSWSRPGSLWCWI